MGHTAAAKTIASSTMGATKGVRTTAVAVAAAPMARAIGARLR